MNGLKGRIRLHLHLFDDKGMTVELRKSLYWVIWAATLGMLCTVVTTGATWTAFQLNVLKANDFQLGLIAAIPVAANVLQLLISYYIERKRNRRFLFLFFGLLGRFLWIPIGLMPYIFPNMNADLRIWIVIVFVVMISGGNSCVNIGFGSLMGDLVPLRIRGRYFSVRQRVFLFTGAMFGLIISGMVDRLGALGYSIALVLAGISAMLDILCFFKVDWPPMPAPGGGEERTPFFAMLKEVLSNKGFLSVVAFFTCYYFAMNIASPFYNVFMIEEMHMSFTDISLINQVMANLITVLVIGRWGRLIDRYGIKPVLQLAALFSVTSPLPYFFANASRMYCIILSAVISGFFWPAMELSQQNMYLKQSPGLHRSMYIAVFFASLNLLGISLGNTVGGYLMQNPLSALESLGYTAFGIRLTNAHYIFLLTSILRAVVLLTLLPRIQEDEAWKLRDVLADMRKTTAGNARRRYLALRAYILRKRARRGAKL